ncbi:hypothetical protein MMC22_002506 [Lobaria immixta]|nr:hypothetical protein [Lobaria immixta]
MALDILDNKYKTWSVAVEVSEDTQQARWIFLAAGPWGTKYKEPANPYIISVKAKLDDTRDELLDLDDEEPIASADGLSEYVPIPFTYEGTSLAQGSPMPAYGYDTFNFCKSSTVVVEALILVYNMKENPFGYSLCLRGIYHLGDSSVFGWMPRPSQKRTAEYHLDIPRKRGAMFRSDPLRVAESS